MKIKRSLIFQIAAMLILIAIAAVMMVIGRGHTLYFDNKKLEYNGQTYDAYYKCNIYVGEERVAKLSAKDRGMTTNIGQNFKMTLKLTKEKGGEEETVDITLKLPYSMDGIVYNIPALLNGLPEEVTLSEFIPVASAAEEEEEIVTDEFSVGDF